MILERASGAANDGDGAATTARWPPTAHPLPASTGTLRVLMIGDIIGKPGPLVMKTGSQVRERGIDLVTTNGGRTWPAAWA